MITAGMPPNHYSSECASIDEGKPVQWASLRTVQGVLFISATLGGRSVAGILDTGAERSIVDASLASELQLPTAPFGGILTPTELAPSSSIPAVHFEIAGQVDSMLPMISMDLSSASALLGERVGFILGGDMLRKCALAIDVSSKKFRFERCGIRPKDYSETPVKMVRNTPFIPIQVGQHELTALLDMGMNGDLDVTPEAWNMIQFPGARVSDSVNGDGGGNLRAVQKVRLPSMQIAGFEENDLDARIVPSTLHMEIGDANAAVGLGVLARYRVLLDIPARRLWLQPISDPPAREYDRTGLALAPDGRSRLRVIHVSRASPASTAGWVAGDLICAINGSPVDTSKQDAFSWAKGQAGITVDISMCSGEVRRLTLQTYY